VQGHFIPRNARASTDHAARLRRETLERIDDLAKYVLDCSRLTMDGADSRKYGS